MMRLGKGPYDIALANWAGASARDEPRSTGQIRRVSLYE